ncbi:MAG: hypothetical protein P8Y75_11710 [Nitrospirota bacterium]|jgi:hypothetical protein
MEIASFDGERVAIVSDQELEMLGERFLASAAAHNTSFFDFVCRWVEATLKERRARGYVCVLTADILKRIQARTN